MLEQARLEDLLAETREWNLEPDLEVWFDETGGQPKLLMAGRLDAATGDYLSRFMQQYLAGFRHRILLDLAEIHQVDRDGLRVLIDALEGHRGRGGEATISKLSLEVREGLTASGLAGWAIAAGYVESVAIA